MDMIAQSLSIDFERNDGFWASMAAAASCQEGGSLVGVAEGKASAKTMEKRVKWSHLERPRPHWSRQHA